MIKVYDRADFPSRIGENLKPLLDNNLIFVAQNFENGTANKYEITEAGKTYLNHDFNDDEIIDFIKSFDNPEQLLQITKTYIDRKNGL